ncbi:ADP-ribosylation factor-like protein 15a isoform X7 [Oryzias latipes]
MDYLCFRALCCKGPPPPRPEYDVVCIGLTGAGKSSLLSRLCSESSDDIGPTTGADNIKKYWCRYYQGSQGVIFVLDSASSNEDLEVARNELHSALQHPQLCTLPFLILANHQDNRAARTPNQRPQRSAAGVTSLVKIAPYMDQQCASIFFSPLNTTRLKSTLSWSRWPGGSAGSWKAAAPTTWWR